MEEVSIDQKICNNWFRAFYSSLIRNSASVDDRTRIFEQNGIPDKQVYRNCAVSHFDSINLPEIIGKYKNDLKAFIQFLETEWGWKVHIFEEENAIIADENKKDCVCPLFNKGIIRDKSLCNCSKEFAKLMFEFVLDKEVRTEVVESVIRGDESCKYRILL